MKRELLIGAGVLVGLVVVTLGGVAVAASLQPDTIVVTRSVLVDATPDVVHPYIDNYQTFVSWSPWTDRDPDQVTTVSEPPTGVGAHYSWKGNDDVGEGHMKTTAVSALKIEQDLVFLKPWEAQARVIYDLAPEGSGTRVTWTMEQPADFGTKVATLLFVDMDAALGPDFDKGLGKLKGLVESQPAEPEAAGTEAGGPSEATDGDTDEAVEGEPSEDDDGAPDDDGDDGDDSANE